MKAKTYILLYFCWANVVLITTSPRNGVFYLRFFFRDSTCLAFGIVHQVPPPSTFSHKSVCRVGYGAP